MQARPEWHDLWTRIYQVALDLGDPGNDILLADLQDEARQRLPVAGLVHRVVVTATTPSRPGNRDLRLDIPQAGPTRA